MASIWVLYAQLGRRSTRLPWSRVRINGGVEFGIVVHLHLAIELEAASAGMDLPPEIVQTCRKVGALFAKEGQACAVLFAMRFRGRSAIGLFLGVIELEREDREAIDHQTRRLGIERGRGVLRAGFFEQSAVYGFDEIVPALVKGVNISLHLRDAGVGGAWFACLVLLMPEIEVGAVMGKEEVVESFCAGCRGRSGIDMPVGGGAVVEASDVGGVEHEERRVRCRRRFESNCTAGCGRSLCESFCLNGIVSESQRRKRVAG